MTAARPGTDWAINGFTVTDGDTIRAFLDTERQIEPETELGDLLLSRVERARTNRAVRPRGVGLRLITVNTPELSGPRADPVRARAAMADLSAWLDRWKRLRCETWPGGGFERLLADVYVDGRRDLTASEHLLQLGWPPFLGGRS